MSYYELETQQGLLPVRLGRWSVKSDYPSTNLWDYVYAPRVRGGFADIRKLISRLQVRPTGAGRVCEFDAMRILHGCGEGL